MAAGPPQVVHDLRRWNEELEKQLRECRHEKADLEAQLYVAQARIRSLSQDIETMEEMAEIKRQVDEEAQARKRKRDAEFRAEAVARECKALQQVADCEISLLECSWALKTSEKQVQHLQNQVQELQILLRCSSGGSHNQPQQEQLAPLPQPPPPQQPMLKEQQQQPQQREALGSELAQEQAAGEGLGFLFSGQWQWFAMRQPCLPLPPCACVW